MTDVLIEYCHAALAWRTLSVRAKTEISRFFEGRKDKSTLSRKAQEFMKAFPGVHAYGGVLYERFDAWTRFRFWAWRMLKSIKRAMDRR